GLARLARESGILATNPNIPGWIRRPTTGCGCFGLGAASRTASCHPIRNSANGLKRGGFITRGSRHPASIVFESGVATSRNSRHCFFSNLFSDLPRSPRFLQRRERFLV